MLRSLAVLFLFSATAFMTACTTPDPETEIVVPEAVEETAPTMRDRMVAGERLPTETLRTLASGDDRLANWLYAQRLREIDRAGTLNEQSTYYLKAARLGSVGGNFRLMDVLDDAKSAGTEGDLPLDAIENQLETFAISGEDRIGVPLAKHFVSGSAARPAQPERAIALVEQRAASVGPDPAFEYAQLMLRLPDTADPELVQSLLVKAQESEVLERRVTATNLLSVLAPKTSSSPVDSQDQEV